MKTDDHTVVHELAARAKEWELGQSIADTLRAHMTCSFFHILLLRLDKLQNDKAAHDQLTQQGLFVSGNGISQPGQTS